MLSKKIANELWDHDTFYKHLLFILGDFPGGSDGKESACNTGDWGSIPGSGRSPGEGHGNPLQHPCLENPHGQRNLSDYSPWGHNFFNKEIWNVNLGTT